MLLEFTERISTVFGFFCESPLVRMSLKANIRHFCGNSNDETIVAPRIKAFCEFFAAELFGTDQCLKSPIRLTGALHRWGKTRWGQNARVCKNNILLVQTLFRCKQVIGYASDYAQWVALEGHRRKVLTSVPDDSANEEVLAALQPILASINRHLRERSEVLYLDASVRNTGSTESSRSVGGKNGRLFRAFHGYRETETEVIKMEWPGLVRPRLAALYPDVDHPRFPQVNYAPNAEIDDQIDVPEPIRESTEFRVRPDGFPEAVSTFDYGGLPEWTAFIIKEALNDIETGFSKSVNVTAVCEQAAKVRTVTSGSSAGAVYSTAFQQAVFESMRELPCFPSLSGKVDGSQVSALLGSLGPDGFAASSDFTAATDLLSSNLTNRILEVLLDGTSFCKEIIMDDNADKLIHYGKTPALFDPEIDGGRWEIRPGVSLGIGPWDEKALGRKIGTTLVRADGETHEVRTHRPKALKKCGQLMGQATSFPLLCLVNLGCTLAAKNRMRPRLGRPLRWPKLALSQVIINGDDRLAASSEAEEREFWDLSTRVGLKKSAGKSHEDAKYACINSQDYRRSGSTWVRVASVRAGLLFGVTKLKDDEFRPARVVGALFEDTPPEIQRKMIPVFLGLHRSELQRECGMRNLFLPVKLGGFGHEQPSEWSNRITGYQLSLASLLAQSQPNLDFSFGPKLDEVPPAKVAKQSPWEQPTASTDAGSLEIEDSLFRSRMKRCEQAARSRKIKLRICGAELGKSRTGLPLQCKRQVELGSRCECGGTPAPLEIGRESWPAICSGSYGVWDEATGSLDRKAHPSEWMDCREIAQWHGIRASSPYGRVSNCRVCGATDMSGPYRSFRDSDGIWTPVHELSVALPALTPSEVRAAVRPTLVWNPRHNGIRISPWERVTPLTSSWENKPNPLPSLEYAKNGLIHRLELMAEQAARPPDQ